MSTRSRLVAVVFVPVFIGFIGISNVSRQARFEAFHNVDVLQLIASGMCFGVALVTLIAFFRRRNSRLDQTSSPLAGNRH